MGCTSNTCTRNACSSANRCKPCRKASSSSDTVAGLLFFSGVTAGSTGETTTSFLANNFTDGNPLSTPPSFPVATAHALKNLAVRLDSDVADGQSIVVQGLKNGTSVPGFLVTFTGPLTGATVASTTTAKLALAKNDTFDLRVVNDGGESEIVTALSASVDVVT
jgi:hypothetical protein